MVTWCLLVWHVPGLKVGSVMYPVPQNVSPVQWILAQVAAKCGVSEGRQLTDSLLHLINLDTNITNVASAPSDSSVPLSHNFPYQYHPHQLQGSLQGTSSENQFAGFLASINQSNGHSTNSSHLYTISGSSLSGGGSHCGNSGVNSVGGASVSGVGGGGGHISSQQGEDSTPHSLPTCNQLDLVNPIESGLFLPPSGNTADNLLSGSCWLGGPHIRMVLPVCGQEIVTVTKTSSSHSTSSKNSNNNNNSNSKNVSSGNNNHNNKKHKNHYNNKTEQGDHNNQYSVRGSKQESLGHDSRGTAQDKEKHDSERLSHPKVPVASKAVDAKEVEKLLQDALWKGSQQQKKSDNRSECASSSGGSDTGYSSRCSTPPGPQSLSLDHTLDAAEPKLTTKRHLDVPGRRGNNSRDSRSESPSTSSVSSQGSYHNPRQKRRYSSNADGQNTQPHHQQHHRYHQNHRPHLNQHHPSHHQYHYQQQISGQQGGVVGGRGNHLYYNSFPDVANRDCTNYHNRRYERGYNNYGYNGHYDYYPSHHHYNNSDGRYNHGYNNRYHNNHRNHYNNHCPPHNTKNNRDQGKLPVSERAGTFSSERINTNFQWKSEVVGTPSDLLNGSEWDNLSQQVWDTFQCHQQTDKTFVKKMKLKDKIFKVIRNVLPMCRLFVVGSSLSGFGADSSDVDMCLMVTPGDLDQRREATAVLRLLQRELNNCGFIQKMELIRAKVPILKFRDSDSEIDVDLNCNNAVGIRNTHLLNSYSQLDWRVRPLVLVVKLWAHYHDINNAKDMTISSYSLVLMVIHYLQHGTEPPLLPCLQRAFGEKFRPNAHILSIPVTEKMPTFTSNNHDSLGKLFHGFLDYFANTFTFIEDTISVRTGGTMPTSQCRSVRSRKNDWRMWKYLCIEEPFDLTNTARSVYDEEVFERVKKVFGDSFKLLAESKDLSTIIPFVKSVTPS
nr:poly(A) RNA polymerase gld-2 homolog B-like [Penaeus vannamei]